MADASKVERGKQIIAVAKSLKRIQAGDGGRAAYLYAADLAGRAGLFLSALHRAGEVSTDRARILAVPEGLSPPELQKAIYPWFEDRDYLLVRRKADASLQSVESLILTYDSLLEAISDFYDSLDPTPEDRGCIRALEFVSDLPRLESEVRHAVALEVGDQRAPVSLQLAKSYRIISHRTGKGLREPLLFSERVWRVSDKAAAAIGTLARTDREALNVFVGRVRQHQGLPEAVLRDEAKKYNAEHLVDLSIGVGFINRTQIAMANGTRRGFLTTSHFYADMGDEFGEDMTDRVKIFLDSIRNGQHFGHSRTGRILDADVLVSKLLNTGRIGPCTAIGTDYITSERAGVVRAIRSKAKPGQSYLELVQKETVRKVHQILTRGSLSNAPAMTEGDVREGISFSSIEQLRGELGDVPEPVAEAERQLIMKLRES